jgi:hypothetical protein
MVGSLALQHSRMMNCGPVTPLRQVPGPILFLKLRGKSQYSREHRMMRVLPLQAYRLTDCRLPIAL